MKMNFTDYYCQRKEQKCSLADANGNCSMPNDLDDTTNMCTADWVRWNNVHSSIDIVTISQASNRNDDVIGTTPEFFTRLEEDEVNVQKATDFLLRLGVIVKTEYGNYRPTYDVLRDIGDAMSRT